jgi:predicted nucleic acid-binding protein
VIADTTFLVHLVREHRTGQTGAAHRFLAGNRRERIRTCIISLSEVAVSFLRAEHAWAYLAQWTVYRLHDGIAQASADLDRELALAGARLGENDNWIAGFCRYYREPIISLDQAFDRVPGIRRLAY